MRGEELLRMLADDGWRNLTKCDGWCLDLTLGALVSILGWGE